MSETTDLHPETRMSLDTKLYRDKKPQVDACEMKRIDTLDLRRTIEDMLQDADQRESKVSNEESQPRTLSATRRTMVAEMTLIIVIVISFSWSAYALYKLFAGGSESLLGYTFASTPQTRIERAQEQKVNNTLSFSTQPVNNHLYPHVSTSNHLDQLNQQDLERQLANYKNQILNELMARQHKLLGESRGTGQEILSLLAPSYTNHRRVHSDIDRQPVDVDELQRWKGGYKLPTSLDYLFETHRKPSAQSVNTYSESPEQADRMPLSSINSHATVVMKSNNQRPLQHSLVHLNDAPSLMQLRPSALPMGNEENHYQTTTTTPEPSSEPNDSNLIDTDDQIVFTTTTTISPPQQTDDGETTTIDPSSQPNESENAIDETTPAPNDDQDAENNEDQQLEDRGSDKSTDPEPDVKTSNESMERVRNASRSIDEDVDRMTQPSLGMASREDKPMNDYGGTVQFDDGPSRQPSSIKDILARKSSMSSDDRADSSGLGRTILIKNRNGTVENMSHSWPAGDLLVADNRHKTPFSASPKLDVTPSLNTRAVNVDTDRVTSFGRDTKSPHLPDGASTKRRHKDFEETKALMRRSKRSTPFDKTTSNYNSMNIGREAKRRRSDDDDDGGDDDDDSENNADEGEGQKTDSRDPTTNSLPRNGAGPTLQDLLAHKKLLDALQQSQLPAPVPMKQLAVNRTTAQDSRIKPEGDHQSAGTQYSVDHGLLLYPASGEEHEHKSTSHKSGKSSKKKGKKKVTLAMKKGGHKNKKHKKEEKKYVKEKKFKGAKKGKKMSKGKGGKGGKKGKKFYKDKGFKKKGFKNIYVKNEFGQKKSYFDEFRDKDFKKKWKNFDDKYNYAQMKKWQAKDVKGAKKIKDHGEHHKKYDKGKWKKNYEKHIESEMAKKKKKQSDYF